MFSLLHPFFLSLLPLFFFTLLLLKWLSTTQKPHKNLPPSPSKLPIIGNLHQMGQFPHRSLLSLSQKHGPLMLLQFGSMPVLVVSSAKAAHEIMKTHDLTFSNRPKLSIASKLSYEARDVAFARYGEYWRQMRSLCVLQLLNNKRVKSFCAVREEETALMLEKIKQSCSSSSSTTVNLSEMLVSLTNGVVCRVALGRKHSGRKFKKLLGEFVELLGVFDLGDYIPWLAWVNGFNGLYKRVDRVAKELDDFLESVVEEHMDLRRKKSGGERADHEGGDEIQQDFVGVLLDIQRDNKVGFPVDRDSIKALILDMFAAGTDTTYSALEWMLAELLKHPKVLKELQNEVRRIGNGKKYITENDLEKIHYLKAVIKETMRLHPPVPLLVPRRSTRDVKLMGYDIAAGTQVITSAWAIGRDPLSWDEPEEFRPERFLNTSIDFKGHDFELIPLGAGRRGCPGIQFAMAVDELALANLVYKFDFAVPNGARGEDLDMSEAIGLTVHKRFPILAVVSPCSF
ncbi:hypothetical protein ACSBR2_023867 [Camellia fascicularis]